MEKTPKNNDASTSVFNNPKIAIMISLFGLSTLISGYIAVGLLIILIVYFIINKKNLIKESCYQNLSKSEILDCRLFSGAAVAIGIIGILIVIIQFESLSGYPADYPGFLYNFLLGITVIIEGMIFFIRPVRLIAGGGSKAMKIFPIIGLIIAIVFFILIIMKHL